MLELLSISLIIILAAISPGPDFALVIKNTLQHSRKVGVFSALGVSSSLLIHSSYCVMGLAVIISQSLLLFSIIKYLGAVYLIYIGIKSLASKYKMTDRDEQKSQYKLSILQAFLQGFLCNLLNPKAIMFILAFFTLVIKPSTSLFAQLSFAIEIALIHFIWFSLLAIIITHQRVKTKLAKIQHYITKLMGAALIGFGLRIAFFAKPLLHR